MRLASETQIAVLTGDLVRSGAQSAERIEAAMLAIKAVADEIVRWQTPQGDHRFTRFRGDGWQIVLHRPSLSLRAAVVIQGKLIGMGMESRISIGVGRAKSLGTASLADAAGEAFELSGRGLDQMGEPWRLGIDKRSVPIEDQLIADLLAERMGKWTAAQAEAASLQLASPFRLRTLHEIARLLGISPQAVNDRVRGAGASVISSVLQRWQKSKMKQGWDGPDV